jgi:hypothetical protein
MSIDAATCTAGTPCEIRIFTPSVACFQPDLLTLSVNVDGVDIKATGTTAGTNTVTFAPVINATGTFTAKAAYYGLDITQYSSNQIVVVPASPVGASCVTPVIAAASAGTSLTLKWRLFDSFNNTVAVEDYSSRIQVLDDTGKVAAFVAVNSMLIETSDVSVAGTRSIMVLLDSIKLGTVQVVVNPGLCSTTTNYELL